MKIQLLSLPRSGSTYLYGVLRNAVAPAQPVDMFNEPFNFNARYRQTMPDVRKIEIIQQKIQQCKNTTDLVIKNHINHFDNINQYHLKDEFNSISWDTIVLIRRDLFKTAISLSTSRLNKEWIKYREVQTPFKIDPEFFIDQLHYVVSMIHDITHNVHSFRYSQVLFYEGLTFNHESDFNRISFNPQFDIDRRRDLFPDHPMFVEELHWVDKAPDKQLLIENYGELESLARQTLAKVRDRRFAIRGTKLVNVVCKMN